ncbi:hypothetical protein LguiA_014834 [Lonicera macranthoides]
MPAFYSTSRQYTPEQYANVLIQQYSQQIRNLYNYGARKIALIGVGQIGCSPNALSNSPDGKTCVQAINSANQLFNNKLKALVDDFNKNLPNGKFIYINAYGIFQDIITRPSSFGTFFQTLVTKFLKKLFTIIVVSYAVSLFSLSNISSSGIRVTNAGCCGVGRNNGQITCLPLQTPCRNRNEYLFWDAFHPTEAANVILGRRSYSAESPSDAYPFDIRRLAQL